MNYLLDTNILMVYVRGNFITKNLEKDLKLLSKDNNLSVSIVSVGEIKSIAIKNKWGKHKIKRLEELLERFLVVRILT